MVECTLATNTFTNSMNWNFENKSEDDSTGTLLWINNKEESLPQWFNWLYFTLRLIQGFISLSANLLTIVVILKFPELRRSCTNYFVASLAIADAFSGLLTFIQIGTIYIFHPHTDSWISACNFELFINLSSLFGNLYGMLSITVDRFIYIQWPLNYYSIVTPARSLSVLFCIWAFIILQVLLSLVFGSKLTYGIPCRYSIVLVSTLYTVQINVQFYAITVTIVMIYILIGLLVNKLARQVGNLEPHIANMESNKKAKKERKTIKVMAMVLGVYLGSYLPTAIYHPIVATMTQTVIIVVLSRLVNQYVMDHRFTWCKSKELAKGWKAALPRRQSHHNFI